jgi:hypothetical protein
MHGSIKTLVEGDFLFAGALLDSGLEVRDFAS